MIFPAASYVVDMHQAMRGYANCVLYDGYDVSDFEELYAEIVMNFDDTRGFDRYPVRVSDEDDYFKAGWWTDNEMVKGMPM